MSTKKIAGDESVHYVSPRRKRTTAKKKMQPPLTPMIDVTFQLLLFFLVVFTFRQAEGLIPGTLPQGDIGSGAPPSQSIFIKISPPRGNALGVIYEMKGESKQILKAEELYQILMARREVSQSTSTPVVIEPREDVLWQHVVDAFNQAVRAKYKKVGFATAS